MDGHGFEAFGGDFLLVFWGALHLEDGGGGGVGGVVSLTLVLVDLAASFFDTYIKIILSGNYEKRA